MSLRHQAELYFLWIGIVRVMVSVADPLEPCPWNVRIIGTYIYMCSVSGIILFM